MKIKESVETKDLVLTHPDKILYPKPQITKLKLFEYYNYIQKWMMPYLINRPLTLVRCPNGQTQQCFFQKHTNESTPANLKSIQIKEKTKIANYIYINSPNGLLALPQLGVMEIHTWGSNIHHIEKPDMFVFDLDPAPKVKWREVVEAAFLIKNELQKLKLKSFIKTTGGKGLHIVTPIMPEYDWASIKSFTHELVNYLVDKNPEKYIATMTKSKRAGKIFIDYLRNVRGATSIAPYSTRTSPNATIATPIAWTELTTDIKDTLFTLKTIFKRLDNLKCDPWKDFFKIQQGLRL